VFRRHVPVDRVLIESDHGDADPPAAIPLRVGWVEHLVGQQYGISPAEVRQASWRNLAGLVRATSAEPLFPREFCRELSRH
jgi:hypothetical protein